ncbi:MAG: hypothetical protein J6Q35_05590 [Rikenellaceae bacterium]|nr:hypothetical protein [Rikenellaceae bacterium]
MKSCWITILTIAIMMLGVANHSAAQDSRFKKVEQEVPTKTKRELRLEQRQIAIDAGRMTQSKLFKDSLPISRMTALSIVVPGLSQVYNKQAWKVPVLYGTVGSFAAASISAGSKASDYKKLYNEAVYNKLSREECDALKSKELKYNTRKTIFMLGAMASYLYFLGDGVMNYANYAPPVKKATTLSMICPGAGQIYNGSYWKVPIVLGGIATMGYIVDFNNRGYQRYRKAYDLLTDGDDNTVDEFKGRHSATVLKNTRDAFRRNRDFSIILTGAFYLLNIIDAHVDAHLRDYDISDELAIQVAPSMLNINTLSNGNSQGVGMSMSINF